MKRLAATALVCGLVLFAFGIFCSEAEAQGPVQVGGLQSSILVADSGDWYADVSISSAQIRPSAAYPTTLTVEGITLTGVKG